MVNFGPNFAHVSAPAEAAYGKIQQARGSLGGEPGSPTLPWYIPPGQVAPATAGDHWVDINGVEHINPGGAGQKSLNALQGFAQGIGSDVAASMSRLTGGGIASAGDDPMVSALGSMQGGILPQDLAAGAQQGFAQQQRDYALAHHGDPYAQAGRFGGHALLGTAAALGTPEVELPAMLGGPGRIVAEGLRMHCEALRRPRQA